MAKSNLKTLGCKKVLKAYNKATKAHEKAIDDCYRTARSARGTAASCSGRMRKTGDVRHRHLKRLIACATSRTTLAERKTLRLR